MFAACDGSILIITFQKIKKWHFRLETILQMDIKYPIILLHYNN